MIYRFNFTAIFRSLTVFYLLTIATCISAQNSDFSPEQRAKLKQFAQEYRQDAMLLRQTLRSARIALARQYEPKLIDENSTKAAIDALSKAQQALLDLHLRNQLNIRQILTQQQFMQTVGLFSSNKSRRPHMSGMDDYPDKKLLDSLALTLEQQKRLKGLATMDALKKIEAKHMNDATQKLIAIYSDYRLNEQQAQRLIASIHKHQCKLTQTSHRMLKLLHGVLNKYQIQQLITPQQNHFRDKMREWGKSKKNKRERPFGNSDREYNPSTDNH